MSHITEGHTGRVLPTPPASGQDWANKKPLFSMDFVLFHLHSRVHLKLLWRQNKWPLPNVGQARETLSPAEFPRYFRRVGQNKGCVFELSQLTCEYKCKTVSVILKCLLKNLKRKVNSCNHTWMKRCLRSFFFFFLLLNYKQHLAQPQTVMLCLVLLTVNVINVLPLPMCNTLPDRKKAFSVVCKCDGIGSVNAVKCPFTHQAFQQIYQDKHRMHVRYKITWTSNG